MGGLASVPGIPQPGQTATTSMTAKVSADLVPRLQKLQQEFTAMQQQAYKIGSECRSNNDLAKHPDVHSYVQTLREMKTKIEMAEKDLEKEYKRIAGKPDEPRRKTTKKIDKRFSLEEI